MNLAKRTIANFRYGINVSIIFHFNGNKQCVSNYRLGAIHYTNIVGVIYVILVIERVAPLIGGKKIIMELRTG